MRSRLKRRLGDLAIYRRLSADVRPDRLRIAATICFSLLATPLMLLTPFPIKIAVDNVIGGRPISGFLKALLPAGVAKSHTGLLIVAVALLLLVGLLAQLQVLGNRVLKAYTGERIMLRYRTRLFGHVQRLSLAYHDSGGPADSMYRIHNDAMSVRYLTVDALVTFCTGALTLIGMLVVTALIDWRLSLVAILIVPVLYLLLIVNRKGLRARAIEIKELESSAVSVVQEVLGGLRVVKAFGQEDREQERFTRCAGNGMRARVGYEIAAGALGLGIALALVAGLSAFLFVGVRHVQSGVITLGALILLLSYLGQLYEPLRSISELAGTLQSHLASTERVYRLLDEVPEVRERPGARSIGTASGTVIFDRVSFSYDGGEDVLHDISFALHRGTQLGIAGTTGAGKTTLISLLLRFYDPTSGRILLDGVDLRDYRVDDLRRQMSVVLQEPVLFSTTVAANIAYANPAASAAELEAAARAANAHDFILGLPEGYETNVGERGMRLSGGERQRISLARAFLRDAPLLVLDEPTSSVDPATEGEIMNALDRLASNRTAIVIAHRPSTLEHCNAQVTIEGGRIVDSSLEGRGGSEASGRSTPHQPGIASA
ncbi:MAG: ABC transporter ATP-binding protein [Solirubrobacteraceae bacterium]